MNALRQFVKPQNGIIRIPVPEDMKGATRFEVLIIPDEIKEAESSLTTKKKFDFKSLAGKFKDIPHKKLAELDEMRNEWERDI
jgi:hypothetical protein